MNAGISLLLACLVFLVTGCDKREPDLENRKVVKKLLKEALEQSKLQERGPVEEQLAYAPNEQKPYTGWVKKMHPNGQAAELVSFEDGKKHGLFTWWYENGQKMAEGTYKDGKEEGLLTFWYENGQKKEERTYKDGKNHGLFTWWYENGQKMGEGTYKDGKEEGLETIWHENGSSY